MIRVQFGNQSPLFGRKINSEVMDYYFTPPKTYVLVFDKRIPGPKREPELYRDATVSKDPHGLGEATLEYFSKEELRGVIANLVLTTSQAEEVDRAKYPGDNRSKYSGYFVLEDSLD